MKIQNNTYKLTNPSKKSINFQAMVKHTVVISPRLLEKTSSIQNSYNQVFETLGNICGRYYNRFKNGFPDFAIGKKLKGLVFKSGVGCDDKNIQIIHYKDKKGKNNERPLIINVLDKSNLPIVKFWINKNGECVEIIN